MTPATELEEELMNSKENEAPGVSSMSAGTLSGSLCFRSSFPEAATEAELMCRIFIRDQHMWKEGKGAELGRG